MTKQEIVEKLVDIFDTTIILKEEKSIGYIKRLDNKDGIRNMNDSSLFYVIIMDYKFTEIGKNHSPAFDSLDELHNYLKGEIDEYK